MAIANPQDFGAVVTRFLYPLLKNDATMITLGSKGVSDTQLPQAATQAERQALYPRLMFYRDATIQTSKGSAGHIRWVLMRYVIVAVGFLTGKATLEALSGRQFEMLHSGFANIERNVQGGGYISSCAFDGPAGNYQQVGDETIVQIGSRWLIKARLSESG